MKRTLSLLLLPSLLLSACSEPESQDKSSDDRLPAEITEEEIPPEKSSPEETSPEESSPEESSPEESSPESAAAGSGIEVLFNGEDLTGWKGNPEHWTVENGVIIGATTAETEVPHNQFLIWQGEPVEDFILTADLRLTSEGNNSGIQYRSQPRPQTGEYSMGGYQCDMHPDSWANGMLYDERGRGILCKRGMKAVITSEGEARQVGELPAEPVFDTAEWNTYRVTARGNHLVHEINDVVTADIHDHQESERELSGLIAFQIHRGAPMKIEIRNVTLERLPKSDLVAPEETPIPEDAPLVHPPKN